MHRIRQTIALVALPGLLAGCDLAITNPNAGSIEDLEGGAASRANFLASIQGLIRGSRDLYDWYTPIFGHIGREGYSLDPVNPEFVTALLVGPLDPGRFYVTFTFNPPYQNIRQSNVILTALEATEEFSEQEKEALRGFVKTIMAHDFLMIVSGYWDSGAPIDVGGVPGEEPPPVAGREQVLQHVVDLLDQAAQHLQAGSGTIPLTLPPGLADFAASSAFMTFNRALKARTEVYAEEWSAALQSLQGSFLDTAAPLSLGAYQDYSTQAGDDQNPLFDPNRLRLHAHESIIEDAQARAGGALDRRAVEKVEEGDTRRILGITVSYGFTIYDGPSDPIPIIRNEELILLRAEANLNLGNHQAAADDINFIRQAAGGLEPIADLGSQGYEAILDELLYNKRYSLMWEGAHRWIDARRYDRLDELPLADPGHIVWPYFPLPSSECLPRDPQPAGCAVPQPVAP